jgi:hypothetical protein
MPTAGDPTRTRSSHSRFNKQHACRCRCHSVSTLLVRGHTARRGSEGPSHSGTQSYKTKSADGWSVDVLLPTAHTTLHARSAHVLRLSTMRAAAQSILNDGVKSTHGHRGHGRQQRPTATSTTTARESKAQPEDGFFFGANPFNALTGLGGMVPPHPRLSLPKRPPTQALRFHAATSTGPRGMHPSRDVVPAGVVSHSIDTRSCAHDGQPTHPFSAEGRQGFRSF